jgi:predicted NAD/FAD-dependent oxidoreductase
VHRWRYAKVLQPHTERFWLEGSQQLGGCGDWGGSEGVEAAFLSAKALTDQLQTHLR